MGLKEDNDASIDLMEAATDAMFPPLPAPRKTSHDMAVAFDGVYEEMRAINDRTADAYTALVASVSALTTALAGKADVVHTHAISQVTGLQTSLDALTTLIGTKADASSVASALALKADASDVAKKPYVYLAGTQKTGPKIYCHSAVVSGGNAVFYLTSDGTSGGSAIFTNVYLQSVQPVLQSVQSPPAFGAASYNAGTKALTIPVNKAAAGVTLLSVSLLGATVAANGDTVTIVVIGD